MTISTRYRPPSPRPLAAIGLLIVALVFSTTAQANPMQPFDAKFKVKRGAISLGTTEFSLARDGDNCYVFRGDAYPNSIVRVFIGHVADESRFCIDANGDLRTQHFSHEVEGNAEDSYTLDFDWQANTVDYRNQAGDQKTLTLDGLAYDPLSIQIAARRWVAAADDPARVGEADFAIVDEKKQKTYTLRVSAGGDIKTPSGRYDTIKIARVDDPDRGLRFWLARYADWVPIQVEHEKGSTGVFRMQITDLDR